MDLALKRRILLIAAPFLIIAGAVFAWREMAVNQDAPTEMSCKTDADCSCKNFNGVEFIPGKTPGQCDTVLGKCKICLYQ